MENASQALLIAGGVLIAILCLTMLVYAFDSLATLGNAAAEKEDTRRNAEWNAEWQAYNKQVLYGADIITVGNKAAEYAETIYEMKIFIDDDEVNLEDISTINNEEFRKKIYKCSLMKDTNNDGRIDEIRFETL